VDPRTTAALAVARSTVQLAQAEAVKSWRHSTTRTRHGEFDLRIADHWAPEISRGLGRLWPRSVLADAIRTARHVAPKAVMPSVPDPARGLITSVAAGHLRATEAATQTLAQALRGTWADGWVTGAYVGSTQAHGDIPGAVGIVVDGIDWSTWQPGDVRAAIRTADGAFKSLLSSDGVTIRGLVGTTIDQLGDRIADGLLDGSSVDAIGRSLRDLLDGNADRALMIAHTETARAQTASSLDVYAANGIRQWDWLTASGACPRCADEEQKNPHDLGEVAPPGHPRCRCAVSPVVTLSNGATFTAYETVT
jgi:SPP1 gp7 family putative phage head morphogenesis protein